MADILSWANKCGVKEEDIPDGSQMQHWSQLPNPLKEPGKISVIEKALDHAFALQKEANASGLPLEFNIRYEKLAEGYLPLLKGFDALMRYALMEQLDSPEASAIINIFVNNRANPDKLHGGMMSFQKAQYENGAHQLLKDNDLHTAEDVKCFVDKI
jgi:hypothetical protein